MTCAQHQNRVFSAYWGTEEVWQHAGVVPRSRYTHAHQS